jgi:type VI protein secretion system component VasK
MSRDRDKEDSGRLTSDQRASLQWWGGIFALIAAAAIGVWGMAASYSANATRVQADIAAARAEFSAFVTGQFEPTRRTIEELRADHDEVVRLKTTLTAHERELDRFKRDLDEFRRKGPSQP